MKISKYISISEFGPTLKVNEDHVSCDLENGFFSLFDGMGGVGVGDKATQALSSNINDFLLKVVEDQDATLPFYHNFNYCLELNAMVNAITCGHRLLLKDNHNKPINSKSASAGGFMMQSESHMNMIFVGNTSGYLLRDNQLFPIYQADQSMRIHGSKDSNYGKSLSTSLMGMYFNFDSSVHEVNLMKGDRLAMFSDGGINRLSFGQLQNCLLDQKSSLIDVVKGIFKLNNKKGNQDNQSAILVDY